MEPLYVVPAVVVALAGAGVLAAALAAAGEVRELRKAVAGLAELQPALVRVRSEIESVRRSVGVQHRR